VDILRKGEGEKEKHTHKKTKKHMSEQKGVICTLRYHLIMSLVGYKERHGCIISAGIYSRRVCKYK